jgi:hypothetical protein
LTELLEGLPDKAGVESSGLQQRRERQWMQYAASRTRARFDLFFLLTRRQSET